MNESDNLVEMIRRDIEKPVEEWSEQDKQDWRDMGWRLPKPKHLRLLSTRKET